MSFSTAFAPNLRTDYLLDPSAVVVGGFFLFFVSLALFVNIAEYPNFSLNKERTLNEKWVTANAFMKLFLLCGLLTTQAAGWARYKAILDEKGFDGYIYGRDIFAMPLSILSFIFVAVNGVILPSGMWMDVGERKVSPRQKYQMRLAMFYFNYIFWTVFFTVTGAQTYRQFMFLKANTANNGTYPTNLETLCALTMAWSLAMVIYLFWHFHSVFVETEDETGPLTEIVRATRFHGFLGMQTVSQKMHVPFYYMACLYSPLVFLLNYNDYFQFGMASVFVVGCSLLGTFMSKNMGTFHFYFAWALWILTTVTYVITDIMNDVVNSPLNGNTWQNPTNNIAGMQLNVSNVVKPVNYPATQNLLTGIVGAISGILFMRALSIRT